MTQITLVWDAHLRNKLRVLTLCDYSLRSASIGRETNPPASLYCYLRMPSNFRLVHALQPSYDASELARWRDANVRIAKKIVLGLFLMFSLYLENFVCRFWLLCKAQTANRHQTAPRRTLSVSLRTAGSFGAKLVSAKPRSVSRRTLYTLWQAILDAIKMLSHVANGHITVFLFFG